MDPTWVSESVNGSVSRSVSRSTDGSERIPPINPSDFCTPKYGQKVFNFTHTSVFSALLLTLAPSRLLVPDSPLLVPAPFLSSALLHGMTFPFLSDGNPVWTPQINSRDIFPPKQQTCHLVCSALLSSSASSLCCPFKLCVN